MKHLMVLFSVVATTFWSLPARAEAPAQSYVQESYALFGSGGISYVDRTLSMAASFGARRVVNHTALEAEVGIAAVIPSSGPIGSAGQVRVAGGGAVVLSSNTALTIQANVGVAGSGGSQPVMTALVGPRVSMQTFVNDHVYFEPALHGGCIWAWDPKVGTSSMTFSGYVANTYSFGYVF